MIDYKNHVAVSEDPSVVIKVSISILMAACFIISVAYLLSF